MQRRHLRRPSRANLPVRLQHHRWLYRRMHEWAKTVQRLPTADLRCERNLAEHRERVFGVRHMFGGHGSLCRQHGGGLRYGIMHSGLAGKCRDDAGGIVQQLWHMHTGHARTMRGWFHVCLCNGLQGDDLQYQH